MSIFDGKRTARFSHKTGKWLNHKGDYSYGEVVEAKALGVEGRQVLAVSISGDIPSGTLLKFELKYAGDLLMQVALGSDVVKLTPQKICIGEQEGFKLSVTYPAKYWN
jgi:hypothetical protein